MLVQKQAGEKAVKDDTVLILVFVKIVGNEEIPFAFIQFPIYEWLKKRWAEARGVEAPLLPVQGALWGSFSGAIAAALTTPLDVIKTRLMLGDDGAGGKYEGLLDTGKRILREEGGVKLFAGIQPRVMWIGIGGFVFFGAYEQSKEFLMARQDGSEQ